MKVRYFVAILFFSLLPSQACTQNTPTKQLDFEGYVLSDSLEYSAESIDYFFDDREVVMKNNATIKYLGRTLKSYEITYFQNFEYMEAIGRPDSAGVLIDTPLFIDQGGEELRGLEIKYNLRTQEGVISQGKTKYETGYYHSDIIKRVSEDTLYVANGSFTTCNRENNPHFYFAGKKMKFIVNDKIIIKPITAYVNDIPVMWFPFYVYPIAKGRQSGFLTPRYGSSRRDGRYVSNLGYYFAPSDYWDLRMAGVLRERNGWLLKNWINYNRRYSFSGSVFGSYEDRSESGTKEWELQMSHVQSLSPTLSITGTGNFQSMDYSRYNSTNLYERLNRDMRSSLTIAKRWEESGNSLTTTFSNEKNLDTKNTSTVLPSMRFRRPRKALFGKQDTGLQRRKYMTLDTAEKKEPAWYEAIYYTFDADFKNTGEKRFDTVQPTPGVLDTVEVSTFNREMNMSTGLSSSFKFMGWLVSEPSLQLSENFAASNKYIADEQYRRNDNFSARLGLGTTVYGTFNPSIGRLKGVRHVIIPSVSYTYGKRRSFFAENSEAFLRFDKNDLEKGRVNGMNINLRNLLQVKTVNKEKENKFDLFALNFSSSVDFEKDKRPVSPLLTTLDFTPLKQFMTTRLSASHNFYHDDDSFHLFSPYLTNFTITTNVGLSQTNLAFMSRSSREYSSSNLGRDDFSLQEEIGTERSGAEEAGGSMRFDLKFSHMYQIRRSGKDAHGKYKYITSHNIKPTVTFSPTRNCSVNYYLYYDIEEKHLIFHRFIINRDLHCWEANISWIPSGVNEGYYFKINIKDLPDIKIEKRRGTSQTSY